MAYERNFIKIKKIELVWIVSSGLKKSNKFFTETLGLKFHEGNDEYGWLEVCGNEGGTLLGIAKQDKNCVIRPGQNAVVTMTVDNLEDSIKELKAKGVKFIGDTIEVSGGPRMIYFVDEDGNNFQLVG